MKIITQFLMISFLAVFLCTSNSMANTYTYKDVYSNWPGHSQNVVPPNGYNVDDDVIGTPLVGTMVVDTVDSSGVEYLASVKIDVVSRQSPDYLFINNKGDWETWDYLIKYDNTQTWTMWKVPETYNYDIVDHTGARNGHPFSIEGLDTPVNYLTDIGYSGSSLAYTFSSVVDNRIALSEEGWTIGYSPWCANDVTLGGSAPVPEPATMLLFGSGLIGLAGFGRRRLLRRA